jgi:DNA primase
VVEGYVDVIRCQVNGFNAVAPLGTALTSDHIQRLWRMDKEPILCFDGDLAGEKAMVRGAYRALPLLKPGNSLRFCVLPQGHDPDSFIKEKSGVAFQQLLSQNYPLDEVIFKSYDKQVSRGTP